MRPIARSLSVEEQALLPANPVGEIELTDADLAAISGACDRSGGQSGFGGGRSGFGGGRPSAGSSPSENTEQVVTYAPVYSMAAVTLPAIGLGGSECDNVGLPGQLRSSWCNLNITLKEKGHRDLWVPPLFFDAQTQPCKASLLLFTLSSYYVKYSPHFLMSGQF